MVNLVKEKIRVTFEKLKELSVFEKSPLRGFRYLPVGYKGDARPPVVDDSWTELEETKMFYEVDAHFWVNTKLSTPKKPFENAKLYFDLKTGREGQWDARNPQFLAFLDGKAVQGLDVNHTDLELEFDKDYDFSLYMYTGLESGGFPLIINLKIVDSAIEKLYYDMRVPYESLDCLTEASDDYVTIMKYLELTCNIIDFRVPYSDEFYESIAKADAFLEEEFYVKRCGCSSATVSCIGHTHIDVAWLWTLAQTEEKTQRTFATMLRLMEQYEEFKFMSSQPQLYKYLKKFEPELYEEVVRRIKEGRWEPEGAFWVEADCNLSSGESFVRQIMHGKRFFMDEFGVESKILWLPDVFGYSAALPQILRKSGVDTFVTSKISWNETNKLPYDVFMWEGIDGTQVFTHFLTAQNYRPGGKANFTTYNADITPSQVMGTRDRFQQKQYSDKNILTFGFGDGGGGPTRKMLEYHRRLKRGIPGLPATKMEFAGDYLEALRADFEKSCAQLKKTPKWVGELYLEFHRGTYTSIAKNKRNNRKSEFLFQTAEQISSLAGALYGYGYKAKEIYDCWEIILLNLFHDIIPGSSIEEVYKDCDIQYANIKRIGESIVDGAIKGLASRISKGNVIYNPNSFQADGIVTIDGKTAFVEAIPPMGYKKVENLVFTNNITVTKERIDSLLYTILFDRNANIVSIYDKTNAREVIKPGEYVRLESFEDLPHQHDNWELVAYYKQKKWNVDDVSDIEIINDGARAGLKIVRKYLSSVIEQRIYVYDSIPRIDFETNIDWKEKHIVLKAAFPINVHANRASYETQFGYIERPTYENTSFEQAKFEVCAHKYADISEDNYGAAILNDCKYGHNAEGSTLKLTILKAGVYPNINADREMHHLTYSFLPHAGNHKQGGVVQNAYMLNRPFIYFRANGDGSLPEEFSLVSCDRENIIIETAKKAETSDALVIRVYDAYDRRTKATFTFGNNIKKAYLC
ncbi:MAG: alpha-mannosidase, partial [Clostridiales bacterium]|nr:alpha-mannosidase [Clostridiales bacterium]